MRAWLGSQIKRQMIGVGQTRAVDPSCSREKTLLLFSIRITTWPPAGATTTQGFSALLRQAQSGDSSQQPHLNDPFLFFYVFWNVSDVLTANSELT